MKNQPLVSIIIPTFNRAYLIGETLDSVLAQTYQNWECIIVDDGSSDNTDKVVGEYVKKDNRFKYYHRPEEHLPGGNGARNYGFKMSQGEYVNWLDSDDLFASDKIEKQIKLINKRNYEYSMCRCLFFKNTVNNTFGYLKEKIHSEDIVNDFINFNIKWSTPALIFKRNFITKNKLYFNENLHKAQEYELFSRVISINTNYIYTENALVFVRQHKNQISKKSYSVMKNESLFLAYTNVYNTLFEKISVKSKYKLFNSMLHSLFMALDNNDRDSFKKMYSKFKITFNLNFNRIILIELSKISYLLTNKGYFFYNLIKYANR